MIERGSTGASARKIRSPFVLMRSFATMDQLTAPSTSTAAAIRSLLDHRGAHDAIPACGSILRNAAPANNNPAPTTSMMTDFHMSVVPYR